MQELLTIVVPGTGWGKWSSTYAPGGPPMRNVARIFGTAPVLFTGWKGENSREARQRAAALLVDFIRQQLTVDRKHAGDKLNLVGFSHGGNVAALATRSLAGARVENLVTIGTPVLTGYQPGDVGKHIHIYNPHDTTQSWGGERFTIPGLGAVGRAGREFANARNSEVDIPAGSRHQRHGNLLWDDRTWRQIQELLQ